MPRHSKNNTAGSVFTYAERQMVKDRDGTRKQRLGRDSLKDYTACSLCLEKARDPRTCLEGHVYCQECVVSSLLAQKKDIKRQTVLLERMRAESEQEMAAARAAARERVLRDFETSQASLGNKGAASTSNGTAKADSVTDAQGKKRKFEFDDDELERRTTEATEEALRKTTQEMADARKAKLPNFWLPSLTPTATPEAVLDVKLQTMCTAGFPHPLSLKSLTTLHFMFENPDDKDSTGIVCPCCRRSITLNSKPSALRPCGHVLCETCTDSLARKDKACSHCGDAVDSKRGFIELRREGTGFAAGGQTEAKKYNTAFQG